MNLASSLLRTSGSSSSAMLLSSSLAASTSSRSAKSMATAARGTHSSWRSTSSFCMVSPRIFRSADACTELARPSAAPTDPEAAAATAPAAPGSMSATEQPKLKAAVPATSLIWIDVKWVDKCCLRLSRGSTRDCGGAPRFSWTTRSEKEFCLGGISSSTPFISVFFMMSSSTGMFFPACSTCSVAWSFCSTSPSKVWTPSFDKSPGTVALQSQSLRTMSWVPSRNLATLREESWSCFWRPSSDWRSPCNFSLAVLVRWPACGSSGSSMLPSRCRPTACLAIRPPRAGTASSRIGSAAPAAKPRRPRAIALESSVPTARARQ
mmetsp:Transcript_58115/g.180542  ORF Transcript_58115/g.180542 Transcript_58115/m.180542 type:complete len:322 (-) Transcript_58115:36-1001(-)